MQMALINAFFQFYAAFRGEFQTEFWTEFRVKFRDEFQTEFRVKFRYEFQTEFLNASCDLLVTPTYLISITKLPN